MVNQAAESVRPMMVARMHDFSVSLPTEPIWVEADPARIEQVVVKLLNNAAKYTDTGGLIRITVGQEEDEAVIRVRDNGVGIAPEVLPQIFELFTQVDGSLGRSCGGLGIGLALARNLVEMHDGRLQASSDYRQWPWPPRQRQAPPRRGYRRNTLYSVTRWAMRDQMKPGHLLLPLLDPRPSSATRCENLSGLGKNSSAV